MTARRAKGEGNIGQRRGDTLRYGRLDLGRDAHGKRQSRTIYCRTREGAEAKLQALLGAQGRGVSPALDRITVGDYLAGWLAEAVRPMVRPRTFASYGQIVRVYLVPALRHQELRKREPAHIQGLLNRRTAEGTSPRAARSAGRSCGGNCRATSRCWPRRPRRSGTSRRR